MHSYQAESTNTLQSQLMNHAAITKKMATYLPSIQYMKENYPNIPFFLDEVGSVELAKKDISFQLNFGAALWAMDVQLYSMVVVSTQFSY